MHHATARRPFARHFRQARSVSTAMLVAASSIVLGFASVAVTPAPAGAAVTAATLTGLACSTGQTSNSATNGTTAVAPANTILAQFTITGGGGASGENGPVGAGGVGGRGTIVSGSFPASAGNVITGRLGCGGDSADSWADFTGRRAEGHGRGGPAEDRFGGGGAGSTMICYGPSANPCANGADSMKAIAGGGGGGGRGSAQNACTAQPGGSGGSGTTGSTTAYAGGFGIAGATGTNGASNFGGSAVAGGGVGGGATNTGGAPGNDFENGSGKSTVGTASALTTSQIMSTAGGSGGRGGNGYDDTTGGGGGAGLAGGGGGGGGDNGPGCGDFQIAGGGGGAGSSWVDDTVTGASFSVASGTSNGCDANPNTTISAATAGYGGTSGGLQGCHGFISVSWVTSVAPTGAAQAVNATKGVALPITLGATDSDGDTRTCSIVSSTSKGSLALSGASPTTNCTATYTANANTSGTDSFSYRVTDQWGLVSPTSTVTITIVNQAPTVGPQSVNADAGLATPITLSGTDPDGDSPLTCSAPGTAPTKGTLTGSGCSKSYTSSAGTANAGIGGADSFTYTVSDAYSGTSAPGTVSITVNNPNLSVAAAHTGRFNPGTGSGTYTLTVANTSTSTANGTTTLVDTLPTGMAYRSATVGTSGFTCTATAGVSTTITCTRATQIPKSFSDSLTLTVDVAEGAASPITNTAVVSNNYELASTAANNTATDATVINGRPTAQAQSVSTAVDASKIITLASSDPDGDAVTYSIVATPGHGGVSGVGASRQYTPDTGFQGVDTFTFRVTDTDGLMSATATVTVYVGASRFVGQVTNEIGGAALAGIEVRLIDNTDPDAADPALLATAVTNGLGNYDLGPQFGGGAVPWGSYVVRFADPANNFISEYDTDSATRAGATNHLLSTAATTETLNAALVPGGRIQGTVRSTAGASPTIDGIQVRLFKIGTAGSKAVTTAAGGQYRFELLTAGSYQVWFRDVDSGQWTSEWSNEQTSQATATTITVTIGQQLVMNEELAPVVPVPPPTLGTITGTVRASTIGNAPLAGIQVRLYRAPYTASAATTTDANGQYTFPNQLAGNYKIWYRVVTGSAFVSEYNENKPDLASADVIALGNATVIADPFLSPPNTPPAPTSVISGTVTQPDGITPIAGIQVRLYRAGLTTGSTATTTDGDGHYAFTSKAAGDYQLYFRDVTANSWFSEWNLDRPDQASADAVTATAYSTTTVDARLTPR